MKTPELSKNRAYINFIEPKTTMEFPQIQEKKHL